MGECTTKSDSKIKRPSRIFEVFTAIKSGEANTRKQLSEKFNVSENTIKVDLSELRKEFNVEIEFDRNEYVYKILDEGKLENLKISRDLSSENIILILHTLVNSQSFMESQIEIIKHHLISLLPKKEAEKLNGLLQFNKSNNIKENDIIYNLKKIIEAINNEKQISFRYRSINGGNKVHNIIPYSFAYELGKYYIIGKREDKENLIHYRLDRISVVTISKSHGKRNEKFNINEYMKKTWFMTGGEEVKVKVKFATFLKTLVIERNMNGRIIKEDKDYFIYEFICNGYDGIKIWLLGIGQGVEVLSPLELRESIKLDIQNMYKQYF